MKKAILILCAALLVPFSCKKQALQSQDEVEAYVESLLDGSYRGTLQMKLFEPEAIPALLSYADDKRQISFPPVNPLSSSLLPSCSVGIYMLWTVEGIRQADGSGKGFGYPSLTPAFRQTTCLVSEEYESEYLSSDVQAIVAKAYRTWWASGSFSAIKDKDPMDGTGLAWQ